MCFQSVGSSATARVVMRRYPFRNLGIGRLVTKEAALGLVVTIAFMSKSPKSEEEAWYPRSVWIETCSVVSIYISGICD